MVLTHSSCCIPVTFLISLESIFLKLILFLSNTLFQATTIASVVSQRVPSRSNINES